MITEKMRRFREAAQAAAKEAREIAEKAEADGSPVTGDVRARFEAKLKESRDNIELYKKAAADQDIEDQVRALANELNGTAQPQRKGTRTSPWAKAAAERMARTMVRDVDGAKAVVSGSIGVPTPIDTEIVVMSGAPMSVLELIPVRMLGGGFGTGNSFSFLRQTVRTNNAAPVADGALKPTSVYTIAEVEAKVHVIAHLTEPVPERYLADHQNLVDFLRTELEVGLYEELENQVITGDGTGENLTGILNTSGIISQVFATDMLTSIRKGLTQLQVYGNKPTALLLNPADLETLDLLREDGASGGFLLGSPDGDEAANIWRVPRVPSLAVAAGTAILGDFGQAEIIVREDATLAADRSGDNFTKNLVTLRLEGRFGFAVKRPNAFVEIDLTA